MRIFVYGTLKQGFPNSYLLKDSTYIGKAITVDKFCMYDLGAFPAVADTPKISKIEGEVYEIDKATLISLDMLEGYPNLYTRTLINVKTEKGVMAAIVYVASNSTLKTIQNRTKILNGVWGGGMFEKIKSRDGI